MELHLFHRFSRQHITSTHHARGAPAFLLLYALVVLAALLGVSLIVAEVAYRSLRVTRESFASLNAQYVAQAAAECALYWRLREGPEGSFHCGDPVTSGSFRSPSTKFSVSYHTSGGSCIGRATVEVDDRVRTITARGYNRCSGGPQTRGMVERGYLITY